MLTRDCQRFWFQHTPTPICRLYAVWIFYLVDFPQACTEILRQRWSAATIKHVQHILTWDGQHVWRHVSPKRVGNMMHAGTRKLMKERIQPFQSRWKIMKTEPALQVPNTWQNIYTYTHIFHMFEPEIHFRYSILSDSGVWAWAWNCTFCCLDFFQSPASTIKLYSMYRF